MSAGPRGTGRRGGAARGCAEQVPLPAAGSSACSRLKGALLTLPRSAIQSLADATGTELLEDTQDRGLKLKPQVKFNLRSWADAEEDGCAFATGQRERLEECGFNATAKTFFIIHGWTVSMEDAARLEETLRVQSIPLEKLHYPANGLCLQNM